MGYGFVFINQILFFSYILSVLAISVFMRGSIRKLFRGIRKETWVILLAILLIAVLLRLYVYPGCERWDLAANFIDSAKMGLRENYTNFQFYRGIGFYYITSAFLAASGHTYSGLFLMNFIIGCGLVVAVFFLAQLIFKNEGVSLLTSFLSAASPVLAIISVSESYTVMALLFSVISLSLLFMFIRSGEFPFYVAGLLMMICAIQVRPDYIVFALVFLAACIVYRDMLKGRRVYAFTAGFLALNAYLFWVIYRYFYVIFLFDRVFAGAEMDAGSPVASIFLNSSRLFSGNIVSNVVSFLTVSPVASFLSFFATFGILFLWRKGRKGELAFMLSYFLLFFFSYSCFHSEGFFSSGLKYIPSPLLPLILMASYGVFLLLDRTREQRMFAASFVVFFIGLSVYSIHAHNMGVVQDPSYQEYHYLMENLSEVNVSCYLISEWEYPIFRDAFDFDYMKHIELDGAAGLEEFISENVRGCFYVYIGSWHISQELWEDSWEMYGDLLIPGLSQEFGLEKLVDKELAGGRVLLYYFENL